jgi:outer membrane protein
MAFLLVVCFNLKPAGAETFKVGVVDMKVFQQKSKGYQKIAAELKKKFDAMQKTLEQEKGELDKLEDELRRQSMMLSLDAQESKRRELAKKRRYVQYLSEDFSQEMKALEVEVNKKLLKGLEKVLDKIAKTENIQLIYNSVSPGLIFYNDALDITERVVQAFDKMGK